MPDSESISFSTVRSGVRPKFLVAIFLVLLAVFASFQPRQAQAVTCVCPECTAAVTTSWVKEAIEWAKTIALLGQIVTAVTSVYELFMDEASKLASTINITSLIQTRTQIELADAKEAHAEALSLAEMAADAAGKMAQAVTASGIKCNQRSVAAAASGAGQSSARAIGDSYIGERCRSGSGVCNGLDYGVEAFNHKCSSDSGKEKTGNSNTDPDNCVPSNKEFIDGSNTVKFLNSPDLIIEVPDTKDGGSYNGETSKKLAPKNDAQKRYVAALDACYTMVGARPRGPGPKDLSPKAVQCRAVLDRCSVIESALRNSCLYRLDMMARPNSNDDAKKDEREAQKKACEAVVEKRMGGDAPQIYKDCVDGKGMSKYAADRLFHLACASGSLYDQLTLAGTGAAEQLSQVIQCSTMRVAVEIKQAADMNAVANSAVGMESVSRCWASAAAICGN